MLTVPHSTVCCDQCPRSQGFAGPREVFVERLLAEGWQVTPGKPDAPWPSKCPECAAKAK